MKYARLRRPLLHDRSGEKIGHWLVLCCLGVAKFNNYSSVVYRCQCLKCNRKFVRFACNLDRSDACRSCAAKNRQHFFRPLHENNRFARCWRTASKDCVPSWKSPAGFWLYWEKHHRKYYRMIRKRPGKPWGPDNCHWEPNAGWACIRIKGKTKTVREWMRDLHVSRQRIHQIANKEKGLCHCGQPRAKGLGSCRRCLDHAKAYKAKKSASNSRTA